MSYSSNPLLPKARAEAVRLVVEHTMPLMVVARRSGIHRITLWRWKKQWDKLNEYVQLTDDNRPTRQAGTVWRFAACTWRIPTKSSRPHSCSRAISEAVVDRIRYYRCKYGRCAVIVHACWQSASGNGATGHPCHDQRLPIQVSWYKQTRSISTTMPPSSEPTYTRWWMSTAEGHMLGTTTT